MTCNKILMSECLTELLRSCCAFGALESFLRSSFASMPPANPQLLLIVFGPDSDNLPADVLHLWPAEEPGRGPLAVVGLATACWTDTKLEVVVFADAAEDDDFGGGANLTVVVVLLLTWTANSSFLIFSPVLLREDVDTLSEEDDLFMSSGPNRRLRESKLDFSLLLDSSMAIISCQVVKNLRKFLAYRLEICKSDWTSTRPGAGGRSLPLVSELADSIDAALVANQRLSDPSIIALLPTTDRYDNH